MNLWAVTMVRDEMDVLPYTLAHLAAQGVAGIIVADNRSTDGTYEWLLAAEARRALGCELIVRRDPEIGYYQSRKMTDLVHQAAAAGADWVLPFDADELWFNAGGTDTLAACITHGDPKLDLFTAGLHNYFPTSHDNPDEPNPFRRIAHRDPLRAPLPKVVVRARTDVTIAQGNHDASFAAPHRRFPSPLQVAHFPWRSAVQFERKVRNGYEAYQATDLPEEMGAHWRQYGQILHGGGPSALREVYDTWFHDPDLHLEHRPAPWSDI